MLSRSTSVGQLRPDWRSLVEQAGSARERAFAPHSGFRVGAAVLTASGQVYRGCNIELSSYHLGLCAERVAMFSAVAQGLGRIDAIALVAPQTDGRLTMPCGACLQVARELGSVDTLVVVADLDGTIDHHPLGELAPFLPAKANGGDVASPSGRDR